MIRTFYILLFLACSFIARAQSPDIRFKHLSSNDGLSQSTVLCIFQDSKGLMWFGTRDGLNKYDGYQFTIYKHDRRDDFSISNNFIKKIVEDSEGNIWIATEGGGLNKFDRRTEKFTRYQHDKENSNSLSTKLHL